MNVNILIILGFCNYFPDSSFLLQKVTKQYFLQQKNSSPERKCEAYIAYYQHQKETMYVLMRLASP